MVLGEGPSESGELPVNTRPIRNRPGYLVAVVLLVATTAHAQPVADPDPPAPPPPTDITPPPPTAAEKLTITARSVSRDGRCESVALIGARVRELDPDYYRRVFVADPEIAGCVAIDSRTLARGLPPALTPLSPTVSSSLRDHHSTAPPKSGGTAALTSLLVTLGGIGMVALGAKAESGPVVGLGLAAAFIGPTTGHIYAGHTWNGGLAVRLVSVAAVATGIGLVFRCFDGCRSSSDKLGADLGGLMLGVGSLTYVGATLYEIASASDAADRYNREHGSGMTVTAVPIPHGAGIGVTGRF